MKTYKNKHFTFQLRIKKYYGVFNIPRYQIEKCVNDRWFIVLELSNDDYKLALKLKQFLIKNPDLITNPFEVKFKL